MSEYWIYPGGHVDFADGDVGDYNHEGIVIRDVQSQIIDKCESVFDVRNKHGRGFTDSDYIDWDEFKYALAESYANELIEKNPANQKKIEQQLDNDSDKFLFAALKQCGIKKYEWSVAEGTSDARNYAMERWRWKTYRSGSIDTWFFKPEDLKDIIQGVEEIAYHEGWSDKKLNNMSFSINVFSSRKHFFLSYNQLKNPKPKSQISNPIKNNLINFNTNQAIQQVKNIDLDNIHPAYKRPGVNPLGDHTLHMPDISPSLSRGKFSLWYEASERADSFLV